MEPGGTISFRFNWALITVSGNSDEDLIYKMYHSGDYDEIGPCPIDIEYVDDPFAAVLS